MKVRRELSRREPSLRNLMQREWQTRALVGSARGAWAPTCNAVGMMEKINLKEKLALLDGTLNTGDAGGEMTAEPRIL